MPDAASVSPISPQDLSELAKWFTWRKKPTNGTYFKSVMEWLGRNKYNVKSDFLKMSERPWPCTTSAELTCALRAREAPEKASDYRTVMRSKAYTNNDRSKNIDWKNVHNTVLLLRRNLVTNEHVTSLDDKMLHVFVALVRSRSLGGHGLIATPKRAGDAYKIALTGVKTGAWMEKEGDVEWSRNVISTSMSAATWWEQDQADRKKAGLAAAVGAALLLLLVGVFAIGNGWSTAAAGPSLAEHTVRTDAVVGGHEARDSAPCQPMTNDGVSNEPHVAVIVPAPVQVGSCVEPGPVCRTETGEYIYDTMGRIIQMIAPDGVVSRIEYDDDSRMSCFIDGSGRATRYSYDKEGRVLSQVDHQGRMTSFVYDNCGRPIQTNYPDGSIIRREFDDSGRVTICTTQYGHDEDGRVLSRVYCQGTCDRFIAPNYPKGSTIRRENEDGPLLSRADDQGRVTTHFYDSSGRLIKSINPDGLVTKRECDGMGRVTACTDADGHTTHFGYDSVGNRLTAIAYAYDSANRLVDNPADRMTTTYCYDSRRGAAGDAESPSEQLSITGQWSLSPVGDWSTIHEKSVRNGSVIVSPLITCDNRGTYTWDLSERLLTVPTRTERRSLSYAYDVSGRPVRAIVSGVGNAANIYRMSLRDARWGSTAVEEFMAMIHGGRQRQGGAENRWFYLGKSARENSVDTCRICTRAQFIAARNSPGGRAYNIPKEIICAPPPLFTDR